MITYQEALAIAKAELADFNAQASDAFMIEARAIDIYGSALYTHFGVTYQLTDIAFDNAFELCTADGSAVTRAMSSGEFFGIMKEILDQLVKAYKIGWKDSKLGIDEKVSGR